MRHARLAWLLVAWAWAATAQPAPAPGGTAPTTTPQVELLEQLRALNAARLDEVTSVSSLFAVPLDDLGPVQARLEALRAELAAAGSEGAGGVLRQQILAERVAYLEVLAERLESMPEASRRILPEIGAPRSALQSHAAQTRELSEALSGCAERLESLRARLAAGSLVGFASESRDTAASLAASIAMLRERSAQLAKMVDRQLELAAQLEADGRTLRRNFLVSLRAEELDAGLREAFFDHLEERRRLLRATRELGSGITPEGLTRLTAQVRVFPPKRLLGTVGEVAALAEPLAVLIGRVNGVIASGPAVLDTWQLAFENEVVTVLAGLVPDSVRREAYALSASLLRDARAEAELAWERARRGWRAMRADVPDLAALFASPRGREWLLRLLGMALVVGAWWAARRATGGLVVSGVRSLARLSSGRMGIRPGTLVRWSGLVQAVVPVLLAWPALWALQAFLGSGSALAALLGAIGSPLLWYALGLQLLLGTTRRIEPSRPALVEVSQALLPRLRHSYARLGLVVAASAAVHGVGRIVIGEGLLVAWLGALVLAWVVVWGAWEAVEWREELARAWSKRFGELEAGAAPGLERRVARWMGDSRWGFALSPLAVLRLVIDWIESVLSDLSRRTDLRSLFEAWRLRRISRSESDSDPRPTELPEDYLREFPLLPKLGDDDALLLPRSELVDEVLNQYGRWRESSGAEGSLGLVGEKGSGKTTLAGLVAQRLEDVLIVQHTLGVKPTGREALFRALSPSLHVDGVDDFADWIDGLCAGPERVVILDEAHNIFLRTVGGFEAYDALLELVNSTSKQIFWIVIFNNFTWRFLSESRSRQHYFRRLLEMPAWSDEELRELIQRRHRQTGYEVEFDDALISGERSGSGRLELVEGAEGYFRLLRETSGGNPRIATRLWLSSLSVIGEKKLGVGAFREPSSDKLAKLSDDLCFALAAICQHENLSSDELRRVLNVPEGIASFAVQYLSEAGFVVSKDGSADRVTLSAPYYRQVLRTLRNKHLLFE